MQYINKKNEMSKKIGILLVESLPLPPVKGGSFSTFTEFNRMQLLSYLPRMETFQMVYKPLKMEHLIILLKEMITVRLFLPSAVP